MVDNKVWKLAGGISVLIGIIVALTPFNLAHVCTGTMLLQSGMAVSMKCNWMGIAEVFLGLLVIFNGLLLLFARSGWRNLSLMLAALGMAIIIIPTDLGLGICGNTAMACHTTRAVLSTSGVGLIAVTMISLLATNPQARREKVFS